MPNDSQLKLILEMLAAAEANIKSARNLLGDSSVSIGSVPNYALKAEQITSTDTSGRVIEGVFDGQTMIDKDENTYPVPANYASKSKLVPGDILKLTITDEGRFIYKQIKPIDRKSVVGPLINEDGQYKVLAAGKSYKVLLASVTYFRANVGDEVTLLVPQEGDSQWGAIEAIIPKFQNQVVNDDEDEDNLDE